MKVLSEGANAELTHLECLLGEREAVGLVERKHAPRSSRGSGLAVAVDAHTTTADGVRAVKEQARELTRVTVTASRIRSSWSCVIQRILGTPNSPVVVEDDGDAGREERVEARLVEGMRVVAGGSQDKEVDDVDDTDAEVGAKVTTEETRSLDDLLSELETDTDEDDVRLDTLVDRVLCQVGEREWRD